jgi:REP element-mobilizing transposase RayT
MPNTYSQIYIQVVFAVKHRKALIHPSWENELFKYITGTIQNKGQKLIAINGVSNHIHILIGMKPTCCLSELVREIKKSSNLFVNEKHFTTHYFQWQEGFGAFSYSHSHLTKVIAYINNQKPHHQKSTFKKEFLTLLNGFEINYNDAYTFDWLDESAK